MSALLRFAPGLEHDPAVAAWFAEHRGDRVSIARHWFAEMRRCGADVRELVHDGCPVACVDAAPFAYVNIFTAHVSVGFFHGTSLPDPEELLEGEGKHMRHVKLKAHSKVAGAALSALIDAAYRDISERIARD